MPNNGIMLILSYVAILVIIMFPLYYTNSKKKKRFAKMLEELKIGDSIITIGGIHGTVNKILDSTIELKIEKGVALTLSKQAIAKVIKKWLN